MSATSSPTLTQKVSAASPAATMQAPLSAAEIDASSRAPLLLFFLSGIIWLVLGAVLSLIASVKLHGPGVLADTPWLTLGRLRPAAMTALLYGFASQTALGVMLWMICRLGRMPLLFQRTIFIAGWFWNLGVTVGFLGILAGNSTGFTWLEMPRFASPILFSAYAVIGVCAVVSFHFRRERFLYISQWYLLAGLFWFPWIYSAANLLLVFQPVRGVVQSIVNAWFTHNFLGLWLTPVGLAVIFYFIPKLSGRPLYSRYLAAFGFWTLALFTNWGGMTQLVGGPVPAWMTSASIVANVLLIIPLLCAAMNWHLTLGGNYWPVQKGKEHTTYRFVVFAAGCYLLSGVTSLLTGLREVSAITQFTYVHAAQTQLAVQGFVGMSLLGALYYIVPRLVRMAWPSTLMVTVHWWCSALGLGLVVIPLLIGGLVQGFKMDNPALDFVSIGKSTVPFVGLSTLGWLLFLFGQLALLANLILLLHRYGDPFRKSAVQFVTGVDAANAGVRS